MDVAYMVVDVISWYAQQASITDTMDQSYFLPYVQLLWPFVTTTGNVSVIESYAPSSNGTMQPFANKQGWFYVKFNLLNTVSCVFDSAPATYVAESLFNAEALNSYGYFLPNTELDVSFDMDRTPTLLPTIVSGLPICSSSQTLPSCNYYGAVNTTANSVTVSFMVSLSYPIITVADFNSKVVVDIVGNFQLLGSHNATQLLPYVVIASIVSSTLSSTVVSFEVLGTVQAKLGLSPVIVAETFAAEAATGNLSLPLLTYWYGASVTAQTVATTAISTLTSLSSSSSGSSSSANSGYPAGSEAIVFYVIVGSISSDALFAIQIQQDIALNLANITGLSIDELLPFVRVTNINGTVIVSAGARRLLQDGPHTSVSFVLLGSVSALSTASQPISATTLTAQFAQKAQQSGLQTPNSGASAPAQAVSSSDVGPSSSTGTQATNGASSGAVSMSTLMSAMCAAVALLL